MTICGSGVFASVYSRVTARTKDPVPIVPCIVTAITRAEDFLSVRDFGTVCPVSLRTLQRYCHDELQITLSDCRDFIWCARAVVSGTHIWDPDAELTLCCKDPRTRKELIERGGLDMPSRPTPAEFIDRQKILTRPDLLAELRAALQGLATMLLLCSVQSTSIAAALV